MQRTPAVVITPGLIAHMSAFIMRQRYQYACMFVDHHSDFKYVYILKSQIGYDSVEGKEDVEFYGVDIKYKYSENELFRSSQ